jgi:hypothetical protein
MQIVVVTASAVIVLSVLLATVLAFRSIPDVRPYRRIRNP